MLDKKKGLLIGVIIIIIGLTVFTGNLVINQTIDQQVKSTKQPVVYTSIYPLYDVATKIAGDKIDLRLVTPNGAEIHSYRPSPQQIAKLEQADILFYNGLGLEPWANKVVTNLKENSVSTIKLSEYAKLRKFKSDHSEHEHEHEDENTQQYDPHLWLNPMNMNQIAQLMKDKFSDLDPANKQVYETNYQQFKEQIEQLDQEYKDTLANSSQNYILVSHSAFGYLADRYEFKQLSITGVAPHQEPSPGTLADLIEKVKEYKLDYVFKEKLANPKLVNVLAEEAGLKVLTLNPIAGLTKEEQEDGADYFSLLEDNLENLEQAVGEKND
ncbi:metal ABC transporter solute-binding protein, Zn/Mn family [Halanaerobaculum tunisiense]